MIGWGCLLEFNFSLAKDSICRSTFLVMKKLTLMVSFLVLSCFGGCQTPTNFGKQDETVYGNNNLEILLPGKNQLEVIRILGQPDGSSEDLSGRLVTWEFRREVLDQATGLIFYLSRIWVTFEKGICVEVQVELL